MALTAFDQTLNQLSLRQDASNTMYNSKDFQLQWGSPSQLNNLSITNNQETKSREDTAEVVTRVIPSNVLSPNRNAEPSAPIMLDTHSLAEPHSPHIVNKSKKTKQSQRAEERKKSIIGKQAQI